jgi:Sugar (and other) transporter
MNRIPILESEVSPPRMRGRLLVSWQTFVAVGIFLGASTNCIFHGDWRSQIGLSFLPAVPLLCLCYVISESVLTFPFEACGLTLS